MATAMRRRGLDVLYLGADVPDTSWLAAVDRHAAQAVALSVVMPEDRSAAASLVSTLQETPVATICTGGAWGHDPIAGAHPLPHGLADAARELDDLL